VPLYKNNINLTTRHYILMHAELDKECLKS